MVEFVAKCINLYNIKVELRYDSSDLPLKKVFTLIEDGIAKEVPLIIKEKPSNSLVEYELKLNNPLVLGHDYKLSDENYQVTSLITLPLLEEDFFDELYTYNEHDLGITYYEDHCEFKLWSPLASSAKVVYIINDTTHEVKMTRLDKGIYYASIKGNLELAKYLYQVIIDGEERISPDPYAIASTQNGTHSVVISLEKTRSIPKNNEYLPEFKKYTDAIIYETSVRDLTIYQDTDVVHKGRFLGVIEKCRRSSSGALVGLDHLIKLGITHLQLLPIFDFATVDETDPQRLYNWGYDPAQYNVPEGSYASNLEDPYSRIIDLKTMISELHKNGIRVNMDVVYNHMYDRIKSPFEVLCPGYYFRKDKNGNLSNGSFCGNDLATDKPMVRNFIVDSCLYWLQEYGVDGFRFDLMGIIDIDTMNIILEKCKELRPDFMIYGEGWNMPTFLPDYQKSMMGNADKLPNIAFFNDAFRDIAKGKTGESEEAIKGYLLGQENYIEGFKFVYMGSSIDYCFSPMFNSFAQSINYVECHDNATLYDKIQVACQSESHEQRLRRVTLINEVIMLSYGIPFIHMGQEVGLTKYRMHNSYCSGDKYNQFDYQKLTDRKWMVKCMNDIIQIRKMHSFLRYENKEDLKGLFRFENLDNGGLLIDFIDEEKIAPYKNFKIFINPSTRTIYYNLQEYYQVLFNEAGRLKDEMYSQSLMINGLTVVIVAK